MNHFSAALGWLLDPANQLGPHGIWARIAEHIGYSALAVLLASLIAVPLGWWVGHTRRGRGLSVALSGGARALPTLGLITLLGLALGTNLVGPIVALTVLAIPSVLAGAYTGVETAPPAAVDGARASGMTEMQILLRVEVPLGLGLLIGGIRAAFAQVIATATLAAYVGAGGLGRFLFLGLRTQDYAQMLAASLLVVVLALVSDAIFALLSRFSMPRGVTR